MQALGGLAAGVAHDFNNILSVILVGVDLVADHLADTPSDVHLELDEVKAAAKRGALLTRRLLAFARQEPECPIEFTAGTALCELVPMLERLMGGGCWYRFGSSSGDYLFPGNNKVWQGIGAMHDSSLNNRIFTPVRK